jgi:hypothetical protein
MSQVKNAFTFPYTKLKFLLQQFISVVVTQLEKCDLPPSKLTSDLLLSFGADPSSVIDSNNVIYLIPFRFYITIY